MNGFNCVQNFNSFSKFLKNRESVSMPFYNKELVPKMQPIAAAKYH